MKRPERSEFRRVLAARKALNDPVTEAEIDLVADYVSARARIADLRQRAGAETSTAAYLQLTRAINTTTTMSRGLAQDLRLVDPPAKTMGKKERLKRELDRKWNGDNHDGWGRLLRPGVGPGTPPYRNGTGN